MEKPLTVNQAAEILGFHPAYIRALLRKGKISGTKPTGKPRSSWRIEYSSIVNFLRGKQTIWFKIKHIASDKSEKRYFGVYRDGLKISIVESADEAVKIAKRLGAHVDNTEWKFKSSDFKNPDNASEIGKLMTGDTK